jgi:hypothetical protein
MMLLPSFHWVLTRSCGCDSVFTPCDADEAAINSGSQHLGQKLLWQFPPQMRQVRPQASSRAVCIE